ncbi:unnamed protein product [Choristocarpus tenellus]
MHSVMSLKILAGVVILLPLALFEPMTDALHVRTSLREQVEECVRDVIFPEVGCDLPEDVNVDSVLPVSSNRRCRFEAEDLKSENMKKVASMFHFRFIGDSTTRRLADSFESLYTGIKPTHPKEEINIDHRVGALDAVFKWTPMCSDFPAKIAESTLALDNPAHKVVVIVTQFGIHDITHALKTPEGSWQGRVQASDVHAKDNQERSKSAMGRCLNVTQRLIDFAQQQSREGLRPIVLLMQGNPFMAGDVRCGWMDELHVQRLKVLQNGQIHSHAGNSTAGGPYMLEDTAGIFDKLECKRINDSIHFWEPVKLTQAKMLWHIMTIIADGLDSGYSP